MTWFGWFRANPRDLTPDVCQCHHWRCSHKRGTGKCTVVPQDDNPFQSNCACKVFVNSKRGGDQPPTIPDPEISELRRMAKL